VIPRRQSVDTFGPSGLLSRQAGSTGPSNTTLYTFDARGNVSQRLSQSGSILSTDVYNAYGKLLSGNPSGDEFGFGGQAGYRTDQETGLCLLGERYYDPSAERFLTRDPAGYAGGMDLYAYCGDNPVGNMDPSGLTDAGDDYLPDNALGPNLSLLQGEAETQDKGMAQAGYDAGSSLAHQVPGVGAVIDINDAVSGCDVVSNSSLSTGQRWLAVLNAALNLLGLRYGGEEEMEESAATACFVAGTPVQAAHGSRPIQRVKTGDQVWSRDPVTGKTELRRVVRTYKHLAHETITVRLADRADKVVQTLTATPDHRFFVVGRGAVALRRLGIGTQVMTRAGPPLVIKSLARHEYPHGIAVYNFEVQGDHTYFVGKANGGTWVHNQCGGTFPNTPEEMDDLMGFDGTRIPDSPNTPGRNKVVWQPSGNMKITYEEHPYHPNAPDWHKGPHWHIDSPVEIHGRYLPGDPFP
jgi:RHS repeat-associated protein